MQINPARKDSWEHQLSTAAPDNPEYVIVWNSIIGEGDLRKKIVLYKDLKEHLSATLLERFIGVVYKVSFVLDSVFIACGELKTNTR